jgi:hypothetical protein
MALALVACSNAAEGTGGQTDSASGTDTASGTTQQGGTPTSDDPTGSQSGTTHDGESLSGTTGLEPTGGDDTLEVTASQSDSSSGSTFFPMGDTDTTTGGVDESGPGDSEISESESASGTSGTGSTTAGDTGTTEPDCVPTVEICNDVDDDCNNMIDDVDVGMDGICDCLSIALVGNEGANQSAEFQTWLEGQGTMVDRINSNVMNDIDVPLDPPLLAKYDILILDWLQRSYTAQEATDVRLWIEGGAGLMSMTGHVNNNTVIDRPNTILGPMGLTYNGSQGFFSGPVTQFNPHPITMGLTSISFYGGLYVDIVDDGVGVNQVIMTLPPGPVGVVQDRLLGQVFVFGDEWVEFDSEWQNMPEIQKFWVQTLSYLGPKNSCIVPQ